MPLYIWLIGITGRAPCCYDNTGPDLVGKDHHRSFGIVNDCKYSITGANIKSFTLKDGDIITIKTHGWACVLEKSS